MLDSIEKTGLTSLDKPLVSEWVVLNVEELVETNALLNDEVIVRCVAKVY